MGTLEPRRMMLLHNSAGRAGTPAIDTKDEKPCKGHPKPGCDRDGASDAERTRAASPCPARIITRLKLETDLLSRAPGLSRRDSGTACIHLRPVTYH